MNDRRSERSTSGISQDRRGGNRRAFPRWPADFDVRYGDGKVLVDGEPIQIGEGGLAFSGPVSYPLEAEINVQYRFRTEGADWVSVKIVIRHSQGRELGGEFLNLRMHDRLQIVDYITKKTP